MKAKEAYEEIFAVLKKHKDVCVFDIEDLERKSKLHLFGLELTENYGLVIDPKNIQSLDWVDVGAYRKIGMFGENYRRPISWSDDGKQPENEMLFYISFPTGPYIFGDDYPEDLFKRLWNELKTFGPKYSDTNNKCLYFTMENAKEIFNSFDNILKKYLEINKEDFNLRRIEKLKKELEKLEASKVNVTNNSK